MSNPDESLIVTRLPREPFLPHSKMLLRHLLDKSPLSSTPRVLELGCGRRSPLVPMLARMLPPHELVQIDARADVIEEARQFHPAARVEQAFAHDLSMLPDRSMDMIIAMSFFDQNPAAILPAMAGELRRVLKDHGAVIYIHNEELNAPATFASFLRQSTPQYLLPSLQWQPWNDIEFCLADKAAFENAVMNSQQPMPALRQYLQTMMPPAPTADRRKVDVPLTSVITPESMQRMQQELDQLRKQTGLSLVDCSTGRLLALHVEQNLFSTQHGFRVLDSGVFELQRTTAWRDCFQVRPEERCFVRGITRFGMASHGRLEPNSAYRQDLNAQPALSSEQDILFIAYQYGLVAERV